MSNKVKPNFLHVAGTAFVTTIISLAVSVGVQWLSLESVVITASPSLELNGRYLTVIGVQNLEKETLSNLSLYFDTNFDVLEINSSDEFELQHQYVKLERLSPKAKYSLMVWTVQPISNGQIIAESDYKTRLDYSNDSSPFLIRMLWFIIPLALIIFLTTGVQIWIDWQHRLIESQRILERCDELKQEADRIDAERKCQKAELESLKKSADKSVQEYTQQITKLKQDSKEMRLYLQTHISQLHKELSFWRDTVRKMLYNSQNKFQIADKLIETVTSTLQTYTTREISGENIDELMYIAQMIADSRELHSEHDSAALKRVK